MPIIFQPPGTDLFDLDVEMLVNPVNTVGVMGAGLARQFRDRHPAMFHAYHRGCAAGEVRIGAIDVHVVGNDRLPHEQLVANLPTKRHWRDQSRLIWVESGLRALVEVIESHGIVSVAIPPLGCGLGGLDWVDVSARIVEILTPVAADEVVHVLVCPPATNH